MQHTPLALSVLAALVAAAPTAHADGTLEVTAEWLEGDRLRASVRNTSDEPVELLGEEGSLAGSSQVLLGDALLQPSNRPRVVSRAGPRREWLQLAAGETRSLGEFLVDTEPADAPITVTVQGRQGSVAIQAAPRTPPPTSPPES